MNKLEAGYAAQLQIRQAAGEIAWFEFEPLKLKLADGAYYKPDFVLWMRDGSVQAHECKGFWREAARVRFKVARRVHPWLKFFAVTKANGSYEVRG